MNGNDISGMQTGQTPCYPQIQQGTANNISPGGYVGYNNSTNMMQTQTTQPPIFPQMREGPPTISSVDYIPGFLTSMIGRNVKAEFIVGASQYVEKTGRLVDVGVNYFVLLDVNSRTNIMCDLYSVRFVTIII